jgi:hypothetical protein
MLQIIAQNGAVYTHTARNEKALQEAQIVYSVIDTSIFNDVEWEFINAMRADLVYDYILKKQSEYQS